MFIVDCDCHNYWTSATVLEPYLTGVWKDMFVHGKRTGPEGSFPHGHRPWDLLPDRLTGGIKRVRSPGPPRAEVMVYADFPSRMLRKSASIVLASLRGSTYRSVCLRLFARCGLTGNLFEHPAGVFSSCLVPNMSAMVDLLCRNGFPAAC